MLPKTDPLPRSLRAKALALSQEGQRPTEIALALGVKPVTVRSWVKRWRDAGSPVPQPLAIIEPEIDEEPIPDDPADRIAEYEDNLQRHAVRFSREVERLPSGEALRLSSRIKESDHVARKALRIESERPKCVIQIGLLTSSAIQQRAIGSPALPDLEAEVSED